jgi:hypothetical protein
VSHLKLEDTSEARRTQRTRAHINATLSINLLEYYIALTGCTAERQQHDYGYDLVLTFYDNNGYYQNGHVFVQAKAAERLKPSWDGATIPCVVETKHMTTWRGNPYPVILAIYDASRHEAYWLHLNPIIGMEGANIGHRQTTVHVPTNQQVDDAAIREWRRLRDAALKRFILED